VFGLTAITVAIAWSMGSIYGSLSPSMVRDLLHLDSHLAAGGVLFLFNATGGACQLLFRRADPRHLMRIGVVATAVALGGVQLAFSAHSAALFVSATVVAGVGQGLCFVGGVTLVNRVAPRLRRAELNTAYNVVGYVALSLPAVGVGLLTTVIGLRTASLIFSAIIYVIAASALLMLARPTLDPVEHLPQELTCARGGDPPLDRSAA
jgi:MFS family permease